jgi:hypothetical protein
MNSPDGVLLTEMSLLKSLRWQQHRPNLMIRCLDSVLGGVLDQLRPVCVAPFQFCRLPGELGLPFCGCGTLVLHDVADLSIRQQIALSDWLDRRRDSVQVVSITNASIVHRMEDGLFLEGLYYRLNVVNIEARRAPV